MDTSKLRFGEMIAAVGGIALFIGMFFFDAFGLELKTRIEGISTISTDTNNTSGSIWRSLEIIRWVALLAVIVAVGLAFLKVTDRSVALPVSASVITAGIGILLVACLIFRIFLDHPFGEDGSYGIAGNSSSLDKSVEIGAYISLLAAIAISVGGLLSMKEEGATFQGAVDQLKN